MANEHPEREIIKDPVNDEPLRERWTQENPGGDYDQFKESADAPSTIQSPDGPTAFEQWALNAGSDLVDEGLRIRAQISLAQKLGSAQGSSSSFASSESGKIATTLRNAFQVGFDPAAPDKTPDWAQAESSARISGQDPVGFLDAISKEFISFMKYSWNSAASLDWPPLADLRLAVSNWQGLVTSTGCPDRAKLKDAASACADALGKLSKELGRPDLNPDEHLSALMLRFPALGWEIGRQLMSRREKPDFAQMFDRTGEFGQHETDAATQSSDKDLQTVVKIARPLPT